jgi:MFS family permease
VTISIASLANITFFGPIAVALPKLVHDFYHQGAWLLGSIDTAWAIGAIVATLLMGQLKHIQHRGLLAYFALLPCGLAITLLGLPLPLSIEPISAIFAGILAGFSIGIFSIIWITLLQELVPVEKLGRVSSIDMMGSYVFLPIGIAFIGVLADHIGPSPVFISGGVITILLVSIGLCFRDIRRLA